MSMMKKAFEQNAKLGMAPLSEIKRRKKFADGGDVMAGFKDGGEVSLRHVIRAGQTGVGFVKGKGGPTDDEVPITTPSGQDIDVSNGEYVLPHDTVKAIGKDKLDAIVHATHEYGEPSLRRGYADGSAPVPYGAQEVIPRSNTNWIPPKAPIDPAVIEGQSIRIPNERISGVGNPNVGANGSAEAQAWRASSTPSAAPTPVAQPSLATRAGQIVAKTGLRPAPAAATSGVAGLRNGVVAGSMIDSAVGALSKPTEDYRRRFGMDPNEGSVLGDLAARAGGVVSDVGAGLLDLGVPVVNALRKAGGAAPIASFADILQQQDGGVKPKPSVAAQPPVNNSLRAVALDGAVGVPGSAPAAESVQAQPSLRRPIDADERARLYAIYGDPARYDPANIEAENRAIAEKYSIPKSDRTYGDSVRGSWDDFFNMRAEEKRRTQALDLGVRDRATAAQSRQAMAKLAFDQSMAMRDQANKDRQYKLDVTKFGVEQGNKQADMARADAAARDSAQKALHERVASMLPPTKGPDGKDVPDTASAARYMMAIQAELGNKIAATRAHLQQNPNDARAKQWLAAVEKDGVHAMGEDALRIAVAGISAADVAQEQHSAINPFGGTAVVSDQPITSLRRRPGILFDDLVSNRGDVIPARAIDKEGSILGLGGRTNHNYDILKTK